MKILNLNINTACPFCGKEHLVKVNTDDYCAWLNEGKLAQQAFPYLSPDEREMLISGICPSCWEKSFSSEDDEPEEFDYDFADTYMEVGFNPYMGCYDWDE